MGVDGSLAKQLAKFGEFGSCLFGEFQLGVWAG